MFLKLSNNINRFYLLCLAGRKEDVLLKYPQYKNQIDEFIRLDPSGNLKYLDWQVKILDSGQALAPEIIDIVKLFDKHKDSPKIVKKDLNQYKPEEIAVLRDLLFELSSKKEKHKQRHQVSAEDIESADLVYNSDNFKVYHIKSKKQAVHYGKDTSWCIRLGDQTYYEDYDSNNVVFFIINTSLDQPFNKIAISVQRDKDNNISKILYWDSSDKSYSDLNNIFQEENKEIEAKIKQIAKNQPKSILAKLANNEASEEEIRQVYEMSEKQELEVASTYRQLIAKSKNLPIDIMKELAQSSDEEVRRTLSDNPNITSEEVQNILAKDSDVEVRQYLAWSPNLTPETQHVLAKDSNVGIREYLAQNPNLLPEVQDLLSKDSILGVRISLAGNPNLLPELQEILAKDSIRGVRISLAINSNLVLKVQEILAKDLDKTVRLHLAYHPNLISTELHWLLATDSDPGVRYSLAKNPNIIPEIQEFLSKDLSYLVRSYLAQNPKLTIKLQNILVKDLNAEVRHSLAQNPNITPEVQIILARDSAEKVKVKRQLVRNLAKHPDIVQEVQHILAKDSDWDVRYNLAEFKSLLPEIQLILAQDSNVYVRSKLAKNPNLTPEAKRLLDSYL